MNTSIIKSAGRAFSRAGFALRKHSPEILVVGGVIGTVVGAVMACKATTKASQVLEESKDELEKIQTVVESDEYKAEYTDEDHKKDLITVYARTGFKLAKLYAPSIIVGGLSIASILGGHKILRGRNLALAAAYATIDKSFKEYRGGVVERFGEVVDRELKYGLKAQEITEKVEDPETGKTKKVKKVVHVPKDDRRESGYDRLFAAGCKNWENVPSLNKSTVSAAQNYFNDKLQAIGWVFLDEVYAFFGWRITTESRIVGWRLNGNGDGYIDFGFDQDEEFMRGRSTDVWLRFNVDGPIYDTFVLDDRTPAVC